MRLDCPAIHSYGFCDFRVIAALQEQFDDLLLPRTEPCWFSLIHGSPKTESPSY